MLVLSRKFGESIVVNGPCRIEIVGVRGEQVKLGFEAGGQVSVHRLELLEESPDIRRLHEQAAPTEREPAHT